MNRPTIVALFFLIVLVFTASAVSAEQDQDYKYAIALAWTEPSGELEIDIKKISIFKLSFEQLLSLLCDDGELYSEKFSRCHPPAP